MIQVIILQLANEYLMGENMKYLGQNSGSMSDWVPHEVWNYAMVIQSKNIWNYTQFANIKNICILSRV